MKNKLLFSSILLGSLLFHTSCTQKQLSKTNNEVTIHQNEPMAEPISNTTPTFTPSISTTQSSNTSSMSGTPHHLKSIQGQSITIVENGNIGFGFPQFEGKIIIFQIFGKDCEYCFEEMPIINRIKAQYGSKVEVVAIQAQDRMSLSESANILSQHHINYPIIEGEDSQSLLRFLGETYGWTGVLPYILLIKNGATEFSFSDGGVSYEEFKESIESLL